MLTGIHTAFIGGDARQLEVIKKFIELDATVTLIGFDNLESNFNGAYKRSLTPEVLHDVDAIILPVVGSDEQGYVESIFCSKPLQLKEEHFAALPVHCSIYTGLARGYLKKMAATYKIALHEILDRDDVAIYNSIPTVEGALMIAIQNTDFTIHHSNAFVLGFGRTGMSMARALHGLGARVYVGARKSSDLARAYEMGLEPFHIDDLSRYVHKADLIFNTIPHLVITAKVISNMPHHTLIIDLASKPGGTDFRYAEKRGIKALLAPGLPGIVAPKSAGQIIANTLSSLVLEHMEIRRNKGES